MRLTKWRSRRSRSKIQCSSTLRKTSPANPSSPGKTSQTPTWVRQPLSFSAPMSFEVPLGEKLWKSMRRLRLKKYLWGCLSGGGGNLCKNSLLIIAEAARNGGGWGCGQSFQEPLVPSACQSAIVLFFKGISKRYQWTEGPAIRNQFRKYWLSFPLKILHTQQLPTLQFFWVF